MRFVVVSVYDVAAGAFGRPAFCAAIGVALRSFQDEVNRNAPDNEVFRHPEDFILYHLGSYDDSNGRFDQLDIPKELGRGAALRMSS